MNPIQNCRVRVQRVLSCGSVFVLAGLATSALGQGRTDLRTSVALVATYGNDIGLTDRDGDAAITDHDFLLWLRDKVYFAEIKDANNDGRISHEDAVASLAEYLSSLAGDFDKDGIVDGMDFAYVIQNIDYPDPKIVDGDINGDGSIDFQDATITLTKATATPGDHFGAATGLLEPSAWYVYAAASPERDHLPFYSAAYQPSERPWPFPTNHDKAITLAWFPTLVPGDPMSPAPPGNHWMDRSYNYWPPNHYKYASDSWFPGVSSPEHFASVSLKYRDKWPPNHMKTQSETWQPESHQLALTRIWPPNHTSSNSYSTPDHHELFSLKPEWQPGLPFIVPVRHPSPHDTTVSGLWPANHSQNISKIVWPPNHNGSNSGSWPEGHLMLSSTLWPADHFGGLSSTWPADTDPQWPANHGQDWSKEWPKPTPTKPPPWADHDLFTTASDIIPLLPVIP